MLLTSTFSINQADQSYPSSHNTKDRPSSPAGRQKPFPAGYRSSDRPGRDRRCNHSLRRCNACHPPLTKPISSYNSKQPSKELNLHLSFKSFYHRGPENSGQTKTPEGFLHVIGVSSEQSEQVVKSFQLKNSKS